MRFVDLFKKSKRLYNKCGYDVFIAQDQNN